MQNYNDPIGNLESALQKLDKKREKLEKEIKERSDPDKEAELKKLDESIEQNTEQLKKLIDNIF